MGRCGTISEINGDFFQKLQIFVTHLYLTPPMTEFSLPRDAIRKRGLCRRPSVRPSVRPSRSCIASIRIKMSSNFFLGPVAPIILALWPRAPIPNSKGNPFIGGVKYTGVRKMCDFRLKSPFTVRDRPMVAMERWQEVMGGGSLRVGSDDPELPWKAGREGPFFQADHLNRLT